MKRYRNGEIWDFEHQMPVAADVGDVILGVDSRTTSTICFCMPTLPVWKECHPPLDPLLLHPKRPTIPKLH
ncbi:hypothetical protein COP2_030248 [Malus domestica]